MELITQNNLTIADVEITVDAEGRYNLNALHRASGGESIKSPSQWLRLKGTQDLIDEVSNMQICTLPINANIGGLHIGTFAHELLAVSYAGWISSAFQLKVNQAFLDSKKPKSIDLNNPEALRHILIGYTEKVISLEHKVEKQEERIDVLESLFQEGMTVVAFCKGLNGVNVQEINKFLRDKRWLYKDSADSWRVGNYARDKYLTEKVTGDYTNSLEEKIPTYKQELLKNGAKRLFGMYIDGQLPMKKSWNGLFTHDKLVA